MLLQPPADSWPQYHGTYNGQRHSKLEQITPQNVHTLSMAWAFQINQKADIKVISAVGRWRALFHGAGQCMGHRCAFRPPTVALQLSAEPGLHIGSRGVGMYKNWVYFLTPDGHLISLNANDGTVHWKVQVADVTKGYWTSMAPLVVGNHVLVGTSGDFDNLVEYVRSVDPETGETQWEWDATPPVGTQGAPTGGNSWMTGTYDPDLNLVYWGTGNPTPVLAASTRPGDDLYTCSIVALNPDTGKLVWAFQPSPHDTHDWDAAETPVLVDGMFQGKPRKMLLQSSRNGYFFVLDRTDGSSLLTVPFGPTNWATGVDKQGRPIPNPAKDPAPDGRLIAPDENGMTNFRAPSFDPKTGLFIVSSHPSYSLYFTKPADGTYGWAGADYDLWSKGVLEAIDYQTGKIKWTHELGQGTPTAGVLTTASGLTFTGDVRGNVLALETSTGKTLWHAGSGGRMSTSPITYELGGRQYLLTSSGTVVFAWALPQHM